MERGRDWELNHMNSEDLDCRRLNVFQFVILLQSVNDKTAPNIQYMKMPCITDVVDKGSKKCLSLL